MLKDVPEKNEREEEGLISESFSSMRISKIKSSRVGKNQISRNSKNRLSNISMSKPVTKQKNSEELCTKNS